MTKPRTRWWTPSLEQPLSHRTILRFQELANELQEDINALPYFKRKGQKITNIFFVSRDPVHSKEPQRFYNARLLGTYAFPKRVWEWLRSEENFREFEPLFVAAWHDTQKFKLFEKAARDGIPDVAHDLLIDAVATLPYKGLLISAFDRAFERKKEDKKEPPKCCWFSGKEGAIEIKRFDKFVAGEQRQPPIPQDEMEFSDSIYAENASAETKDKTKQLLIRLFDGFLNPFMRGSRPSSRIELDWPYDSPAESLNGFVVPAYNKWNTKVKGWQGGMAGWVICFVDQGFRLATSVRKTDPTWTGFTQALRPFVRRVREAHLRELLEKYANDAASSIQGEDSFFRGHLDHLIGWKCGGSPIFHLTLSRNGKQTKDLKVNVSPLWDTQWTKKEGIPFEAEWLCKQFLDGLTLIQQRSEAQRQRDILQGQTRVSHGITRTVDQALTFTAELAQAIIDLKSGSAFPIRSFDELPEAIRLFEYPVSLYSIAIENACKDGLDPDNFRRWLPCIPWIDDALRIRGIDAQLLSEVSERIAKPLAKNSRRHFYGDAGKIDKCRLETIGSFPGEELSRQGLDLFQRKVLLALIVELLLEAFQHCNEEMPLVSVTIDVTPTVSVTISNSTTNTDAESRIKKSQFGNQQRTLDVLRNRLPTSWRLTPPEIHSTTAGGESMWQRRIFKISQA